MRENSNYLRHILDSIAVASFLKGEKFQYGTITIKIRLHRKNVAA